MRQRNIKNLEEKQKNLNEYYASEPKSCKGKWNLLFTNNNPIYLEIGCGKGKFILEQSKLKNGSNFIGIEGQKNILIRALEKIHFEDVKNVKFINAFVDDIRDYFDENEVAGIYLNFSDPWPKAKHAKRRLTFGKRLKHYSEVLSSDGYIEIKTDNEELFDFTIEQIEEEKMEIVEMSRDLHNSDYFAKEVTTEYEDKFAGIGKNINYVKIKPKKS